MKCSKCGHRCNSIQAMAKHYRQKHPKSMTRKTKSAPMRSESSLRKAIFAELKRMGY